MKRNKNESGRSMVEMLGVLAIIGVLSVGGIAGYRMAMSQKKVNDAMNIINYFYSAVVESDNLDNHVFRCAGNYTDARKPQTQFFASNYLGIQDPVYDTTPGIDTGSIWTDIHKGVRYKGIPFSLQGAGKSVGIWIHDLSISECEKLTEMFYNSYYDAMETKEEITERGAQYEPINWQYPEDGLEKAKARCSSRAKDGKVTVSYRFPYYTWDNGEWCLAD